MEKTAVGRGERENDYVRNEEKGVRWWTLKTPQNNKGGIIKGRGGHSLSKERRKRKIKLRASLKNSPKENDRRKKLEAHFKLSENET